MSVSQFLKHLQEVGPATASDIADEIGISSKHVSAIASRLLKPSVTYDQRIHISGWTYDHPGQIRYPRPIFSFGPGKSVKKPRINYTDRYRRAYKIRTFRHITSVFSLAVSIKKRYRHAVSEAASRHVDMVASEADL